MAAGPPSEVHLPTWRNVRRGELGTNRPDSISAVPDRSDASEPLPADLPPAVLLAHGLPRRPLLREGNRALPAVPFPPMKTPHRSGRRADARSRSRPASDIGSGRED